MTATPYRVGIVTEPPVYLELQASVDKACNLIAEAAASGAKLVVFGESWLAGYPFWVWLRSVPESMPLTARLFENSLVIDSAETQQLCQAAKDNQIFVIMGINERDGGTIYNSLLFIDTDGRIPLVRRKLKPTGAERMVWGQGDGSRLKVVANSELGVLGGMLCWEHTMHGMESCFCGLGEQVHVAAWPSFSIDIDYALSEDANASLGQAYAMRTQSFVVNAATVIQQDVVDLVCQNDKDRQFFRTGGGFAQVFAPNGQPLMPKSDEHQAGIHYADINLQLVTFAKLMCDSTGHYARPDVLGITVNQGKTQTVAFVQQEMESHLQDAPLSVANEALLTGAE